MKIHLDKEAGIISLTIGIALLLMLSVMRVQAQGQSCNKVIIQKKVQSSYEHYMMLIKTKYGVPCADTLVIPLKKKAAQGGGNTLKRIKKGVSYMLISGNTNEIKDNAVREFCYLPGSSYSNYTRYEEHK